MMKKLFLILMIPVPILLSSCAEMNSKFDCPMKPGVSCASLDEVNARVDRGEIGSVPAELTYRPVASNYVVNQKQLISPASFNEIGVRKPLRYGESIQRIWVAPFEDTSGNYHQESDIYTIVKPGHWIGYPIKAINNEEE
jgi:conjugal transfer pilus assembly protein TraV